MGSPLRTTVTHRLSLSVLRLPDRITRQRVGSPQQLVLALALVGALMRSALGMFVPRAGLHALKDLLLLRVELVLREHATVKQPFQLGQFIHALVCRWRG